MENFGKFMTVVLALIISPLISGFVLLKLWGWFIVPIFNIHPLRFVEVIGLVIVINFIQIKYTGNKEENFWEDFFKKLVFVVMAAMYFLFIGWLVHLMM